MAEAEAGSRAGARGGPGEVGREARGQVILRYPSAPLLLRLWTAQRFPASRVATSTPENLQAVLAARDAVIRVQRYGGPDDTLTIDQPLMDVDVFATSWDEADAICGQVRDAWRTELPGVTIDAGVDGKAVVARVRTTSGPAQRPTTDSMVQRCGASFQVWLHAL